ncbi:hypothetical protein A1O7_05970 [Cladophialophora yegresii CBS 114405]|uniref:Ricin B lectin domain-containing protein n=1 Tax=Cladophialophora yegresii CBS 114405 TaxID=1182544 RepID=W9VSK5_9EURO|nr:uncharacterized protein A1O7_05970 [Cladophialophora yegresii CBS 114405]EXJ58543.1 hypothetical protein A1O7_05970 [Cladophialophora yegresii CBS 114405]
MIPLVRTVFLLGAASLVAARPVVEHRAVTQLDQAATEEAQRRDDTATRPFSSVPIKTSGGQCLFVDPLSGDFRANLTPIQVGTCDGSQAQEWDVITAGKHNNVAGSASIVSGLTQACFNFDPRRAAGNQVLLFSCGGRADGGGLVTDSQLFPVSGGAGPLAFTPENAPGSCFTVNGAVIDIAVCDSADPNQSFTFGDSAPAVSAPSATTADAASVATVTVTPVPVEAATSALATAIITTPAPDAAPATTTATAASAGIISVSRAGSVLNPSDAAEANPRDDTATRAFSGVSIKSSSGQCLFIDPTAGDFRENLIPIVLQPCDGSANQQWDFLTAGAHNNEPGSTLVVSSLTQGCLNFDPRRAAGDTVIMFSCGGRADGGGLVTDSQLFPFTEGETSLRLQPGNGDGQVCLSANADGRLDQAPCSDDAGQVFTIG